MADVTFFTELKAAGKLDWLYFDSDQGSSQAATPSEGLISDVVDQFYASGLARFSDLWLKPSFYDTPAVVTFYTREGSGKFNTNLGCVMLKVLFEAWVDEIQDGNLNQQSGSEFYTPSLWRTIITELLDYVQCEAVTVDKEFQYYDEDECDTCGHYASYSEQLIKVSSATGDCLHFLLIQDELSCYDWETECVLLNFFSISLSEHNQIDFNSLKLLSLNEVLAFEQAKPADNLRQWLLDNHSLVGLTYAEVESFPDWNLIPRSWVYTPCFWRAFRSRGERKVQDYKCLPYYFNGYSNPNPCDPPSSLVKYLVKEGLTATVTERLVVRFAPCTWCGSATSKVAGFKLEMPLASKHQVASEVHYKNGLFCSDEGVVFRDLDAAQAHFKQLVTDQVLKSL